MKITESLFPLLAFLPAIFELLLRHWQKRQNNLKNERMGISVELVQVSCSSGTLGSELVHISRIVSRIEQCKKRVINSITAEFTTEN